MSTVAFTAQSLDQVKRRARAILVRGHRSPVGAP
jgi:hypothetical protein